MAEPESDRRKTGKQPGKPPKRRPYVPKGRPRFARKPASLADDDTLQLYGLHAVEAALRNPARQITRLRATPNAANKLAEAIAARDIAVETVTPKALDKLLGHDAVHQGVLLDTAPLPPLDLEDIAPASLVLALDQVTDPHNVGALLRSAAAFGAEALIMQARHSAPLNAVLAKSASGALDVVPVVLVRNLGDALEELKERGFFVVGLAEQGASALSEIAPREPLCVVLGAEGKGLRERTRTVCDQLCRIETDAKLASLNVSNAGAIALYWARTGAKPVSE
jgi:23S rRNA (guanosine2251-2'-O)-methyltransferase